MEKRYPSTVMATACIPWTKDWSFDKKLFCDEVELLKFNKIKSIYLYGTAGEGYAMTNSQYVEIVKTFSDIMQGPGLRPMIGVISLSMSEIIERIEMARDLGLRDFQISFPSWAMLRDTEAVLFLHTVCDRFKDCNFLHYNNGLRSKKRLYARDYKKLAGEIPNLVAVKNAGATVNDCRELMQEETPIQHFFLEFMYSYASMFGDASILISYLNLNYDYAWKYYEAGRKKDAKTLFAIDAELQKIADAFGRALPGDRIDGAYDKLFVKMSIPDFPQTLYPPYEGISDSEFNSFGEEIKSTLPHWFKNRNL